MFGATILVGAGLYFRYLFMSTALFIMVLYVWSRRHPEEMTSFWMFQFKAAYLPWVMLGFSFIMGDDVVVPLLGLLVGHLYYVLQEVLPTAESPLKGWRLLATPNALYRALRLPSTSAAAAYVHLQTGRRPEDAGPPARVWGAGRPLNPPPGRPHNE